MTHRKELLRLWRLEKGISKRELSEQVGISQPTIDKSEKGLFTLKTWNKLVTFYGKTERVSFDEND